MTIIELRGRITDDGELEVELPAGLPSGAVRVTIQPLTDDLAASDQTWTEDELKAALVFRPVTGAKIAESGVFGVWADQGIDDSLEWVLEQRRKRREQRGW